MPLRPGVAEARDSDRQPRSPHNLRQSRLYSSHPPSPTHTLPYLIWRRRLLIRLRPLAKAGPVGLRLVKQGDVIRSGGLEAVPHLLGLGCVIWGRKKAVAGSFARSAVSLGQRGGVGRQAGVQAAAAPPAPGAAEGQLMPVPGAEGLRLGRGFPGVAAVASSEAAAVGGGGGETKHVPTPPPRGAAAATELLGLIQVRRGGRSRRGSLSCCLSCCCWPRRRRSRSRGPHPTPLRSGGGGQNEASCGPASRRRACPGPAPSAGRRG